MKYMIYGKSEIFLVLQNHLLREKLKRSLLKYDKFLKFPAGKDISDSFNDLFNVTYEKGLWLSVQDKKC